MEGMSCSALHDAVDDIMGLLDYRTTKYRYRYYLLKTKLLDTLLTLIMTGRGIEIEG